MAKNAERIHALYLTVKKVREDLKKLSNTNALASSTSDALAPVEASLKVAADAEQINEDALKQIENATRGLTKINSLNLTGIKNLSSTIEASYKQVLSDVNIKGDTKKTSQVLSTTISDTSKLLKDYINSSQKQLDVTVNKISAKVYKEFEQIRKDMEKLSTKGGVDLSKIDKKWAASYQKLENRMARLSGGYSVKIADLEKDNRALNRTIASLQKKVDNHANRQAQKDLRDKGIFDLAGKYVKKFGSPTNNLGGYEGLQRRQAWITKHYDVFQQQLGKNPSKQRRSALEKQFLDELHQKEEDLANRNKPKSSFDIQEQKNIAKRNRKMFMDELKKVISSLGKRNAFTDLLKVAIYKLGQNHPLLATIALHLPMLIGAIGTLTAAIALMGKGAGLVNTLNAGGKGFLRGFKNPNKSLNLIGAGLVKKGKALYGTSGVLAGQNKLWNAQFIQSAQVGQVVGKAGNAIKGLGVNIPGWVKGLGKTGPLIVGTTLAGGVLSGSLQNHFAQGKGTTWVTENAGTAAGAWGGAKAGAALGGAIGSAVPIIGNVAGAIIGGLIGAAAGAAVGKHVGKAVSKPAQDVADSFGLLKHRLQSWGDFWFLSKFQNTVEKTGNGLDRFGNGVTDLWNKVVSLNVNRLANWFGKIGLSKDDPRRAHGDAGIDLLNHIYTKEAALETLKSDIGSYTRLAKHGKGHHRTHGNLDLILKARGYEKGSAEWDAERDKLWKNKDYYNQELNWVSKQWLPGLQKQKSLLEKEIASARDLRSNPTYDYKNNTYRGYKISSQFGEQRNGYTHKGIDLAVPANTKYGSDVSGTVLSTGYEKNGYGNYVIIKDAQGNKHTYGHFNSIGVKEGQEIKRGDILGLTGSTGRSSGPHVHWDVTTSSGVKINPLNTQGALVYDKTTGTVQQDPSKVQGTTQMASNGVREALMKHTSGAGNKSINEKTRSLIFAATDVTGSLGVWGVTQLNNSGGMRVGA